MPYQTIIVKVRAGARTRDISFGPDACTGCLHSTVAARGLTAYIG